MVQTERSDPRLSCHQKNCLLIVWFSAADPGPARVEIDVRKSQRKKGQSALMRTTEHASYNRQAPALPLAMKQTMHSNRH